MPNGGIPACCGPCAPSLLLTSSSLGSSTDRGFSLKWVGALTVRRQRPGLGIKCFRSGASGLSDLLYFCSHGVVWEGESVGLQGGGLRSREVTQVAWMMMMSKRAPDGTME